MTKPTSKKTAPKTSRTKRARAIAPASVPLQLDIIGWMLGGTTDDTRQALAAARAALASLGHNDGARHDIMGEFDQYVLARATRHSAVVDAALETDPGNVEGELICAFSGPAYLAGMAVTWLMLRGEEGAR